MIEREAMSEKSDLDAIDHAYKEQLAFYLRVLISSVPKDSAMTVEGNETSQNIEERFVE